MRNTYLTDKFLDKRDLLNEHALQSWAIKKIRNKRTFISLHFTANNAIVKKGDIQLLIDRETAKKLTEIFNKEFEFDEIYKSIYKKYWSNIIEMAKPINAEIKLIDKIISIEGLRYWGDLLNIRTFYKILNKYENK